ncbi:hypothetical protein [Pseudoalteromonas obscura]|uniref:Lipoprotein n=1 Tax=Pseudoalteromonas obscura TaxID=3048491 RepID=A0ABT7ET99_9GAMM|nr:hypothetical protein [Pseudoalteromonas sp. P94(2023)]MDK2598285.1 hypothetical protein [Pseudoalteromonas sp. P94(2023)]
MITTVRQITVTALAFCIAGCANTTTVHIYAKYIPNEASINLRAALEEKGFAVETNTLDFPTTISRNTILHSLMLQDPDALQLVKQTAQNSGFKTTNIQALKEGNHWYTKNSIAIYPFPKDKQNSPLLKADLVREFETSSCGSTFKLNLLQNGAYEISGSTIAQEDPALLKGTWHYAQYPYMELRPYKGIGWSRYFEHRQMTTQDKVSQIKLIQLNPIEPHHVSKHCVYEFGTRM